MRHCKRSRGVSRPILLIANVERLAGTNTTFRDIDWESDNPNSAIRYRTSESARQSPNAFFQGRNAKYATTLEGIPLMLVQSSQPSIQLVDISTDLDFVVPTPLPVDITTDEHAWIRALQVLEQDSFVSRLTRRYPRGFAVHVARPRSLHSAFRNPRSAM